MAGTRPSKSFHSLYKKPWVLSSSVLEPSKSNMSSIATAARAAVAVLSSDDGVSGANTRSSTARGSPPG